jgi:hypothetical protein
VGLPVDLWVVLLEPCKPKYNVLFPQTSDCGGSPLCVAIVTETAFMISMIDLASFGLLSTLNIGIARWSFWVVSVFHFTYARSMNCPVAPQSTSAGPDLTSAVSVVWTSTLMTLVMDDSVGQRT